MLLKLGTFFILLLQAVIGQNPNDYFYQVKYCILGEIFANVNCFIF